MSMTFPKLLGFLKVELLWPLWYPGTRGRFQQQNRWEGGVCEDSGPVGAAWWFTAPPVWLGATPAFEVAVMKERGALWDGVMVGVSRGGRRRLLQLRLLRLQVLLARRGPAGGVFTAVAVCRVYRLPWLPTSCHLPSGQKRVLYEDPLWGSSMRVLHEGLLWRSSMRVFYEGPQWGSSIRVFCEGSLWGSSMRIFYEGPQWGSSMRVFYEGFLWGSSMRVFYKGLLWGSSMRVLNEGPL